MRGFMAGIGVLVVVGAGWGAAGQKKTDTAGDICTIASRVTPVRGLPEGSGVAISRTAPGSTPQAR
jgi:hypothetical protein